MNPAIEELVKKTKKTFPKSFVNQANELIFEPKNNLYFRLEDVDTELDFQCKMFAWLSRPICKGLTDHWSKKVLKNFNQFLGTHFTKEEMNDIYTYLGNDVNRPLCIEFVRSNYDFSLLKKSS